MVLVSHIAFWLYHKYPIIIPLWLPHSYPLFISPLYPIIVVAHYIPLPHHYPTKQITIIIPLLSHYYPIIIPLSINVLYFPGLLSHYYPISHYGDCYPLLSHLVLEIIPILSHLMEWFSHIPWLSHHFPMRISSPKNVPYFMGINQICFLAPKNIPTSRRSCANSASGTRCAAASTEPKGPQ